GTSVLPPAVGSRFPEQRCGTARLRGSRVASSLLEPCALRGARPVLRGRGRGDPSLLPDNQTGVSFFSRAWPHGVLPSRPRPVPLTRSCFLSSGALRPSGRGGSDPPHDQLVQGG